MVSKDLDDASKQALFECFQSFDSSGDGRIDIDELPAVLNFVGFHHTEQHVKDILRLLNKDRRSSLAVQDLVENYQILVEHSLHGDQLLSAFKKLDTNNDGYLDLSELQKVLTCTGEKWSAEEASQFLQELMAYDSNNDGRFSYSEFVQMFQDNSFPFVKPELPKPKLTESFKIQKKIGDDAEPKPSTPGNTA